MMETIAVMLSQALAFLCFYWILKKYAWGPIVRLIDDRNEKIEEGFRRAEAAEKQAGELRAEYEAHMRRIEDEAREKIQAAVNEGRRVAGEINDNARAEARRIEEKARQIAELEFAKARIALKDEIVRLTLEASEKLLRERLSDASHRRLVEDFVEEMSRQP
ncbi:MAG: F0F1 ATP synthase subunit B [Candidatus Sumerlaeota bacterium]|nr:F0F1 ATP synthase subunit B [Candidatus Sumerlaeota bacterium]